MMLSSFNMCGVGRTCRGAGGGSCFFFWVGVPLPPLGELYPAPEVVENALGRPGAKLDPDMDLGLCAVPMNLGGPRGGGVIDRE